MDPVTSPEAGVTAPGQRPLSRYTCLTLNLTITDQLLATGGSVLSLKCTAEVDRYFLDCLQIFLVCHKIFSPCPGSGAVLADVRGVRVGVPGAAVLVLLLQLGLGPRQRVLLLRRGLGLAVTLPAR